MDRRDLSIGFIVIAAIGVIASSVIMFAVSGLGTTDEYFVWQQVVNFFIMLNFVGLLLYILDERKKEQSQIPEENTGNLE